MNFEITETDSLEMISSLESRAFGNQQKFHSTDLSKNQQAKYWLILEEGVPVGFAIVILQESDAHLKLFGVIPEKRRRRAAKFLLQHIENTLAKNDFSRLTVHTYNRWNVMLRFLLGNDYRIVKNGI